MCWDWRFKDVWETGSHGQWNTHNVSLFHCMKQGVFKDLRLRHLKIAFWGHWRPSHSFAVCVQTLGYPLAYSENYKWRILKHISCSCCLQSSLCLWSNTSSTNFASPMTMWSSDLFVGSGGRLPILRVSLHSRQHLTLIPLSLWLWGRSRTMIILSWSGKVAY